MMKLKAFLKLLVALLAAASLQAAIAPTAHVAALDPSAVSDQPSGFGWDLLLHGQGLVDRFGRRHRLPGLSR